MSWRKTLRDDADQGEDRRAMAGVATIDEALDASTVTAMDPEDRALQELALALREQSPQPREDFAQRLDARVAHRFPRERDGRLWRAAERLGFAGARPEAAARNRRRLRPSLPVLAGGGTALAALVALLVAGSLLSTPQGDTTQSVDGTAVPGASSQAEPPSLRRELSARGGAAEDIPFSPGRADAGQAADTTEGFVAGAGGSRVPVPPPTPLPSDQAGAGRENRQVERLARMTLAAPAQELSEVAAGIATVADRRGGFLLNSSLSTGREGTGGSFELRVPVDELEPTIAELSDLAQVRALTQSGEDLTAQVVTSDRTAERARAQRAELERRAERAETEDEQRQLRERIRALTLQLRSARDESDRLSQRTSFATVAVTLEQAEDSGGALGGAIDDMVGLLEGALALALRLLGVMIPVAILAVLVGLAARAARRRRRESVLA